MLPLDVLPHVLGQLQWRVGDLAACCRVSRAWHHFATPHLYERVWLRDHLRLVRVFATLAAHPHLARHVRILEIRVFPFGLVAERLEELEAQIERALQHMTRLVALHWTRTGSLSDRLVLSAFCNMAQLRTLEVSGDSRTYSPAILVDRVPRTVTNFSVILPDRRFGEYLVPLAATLQLESLTVVALQSSVVTDAILTRIAPHVPRLRKLALAGCRAVHGSGVLVIAEAARLAELALEGCTLDDGFLRALAPHLDSLRALTLTHPDGPGDAFFAELAALVRSIALERLVLYAIGGSPPVLTGEQAAQGRGGALEGPAGEFAVPAHTPALDAAPAPANHTLTTPFVKALVFGRSSHLRTLRVHGIAISLYQLELISMSTLSDSFEDLAIHLYEGNFGALAAALRRFRMLRALHIQSHLRSDAQYSESQMAELARACHSLRCLGFRNRMWRVEDGALLPWDMAAGIFPETMMMVRA